MTKRPDTSGETEAERLARELEEARKLLNRGLMRAAEERLVPVIEMAQNEPQLAGAARALLSEALEWQGRYNEAFAAVSMYEAADARANLSAETSLELRVRLGIACNYTGDCFSILNLTA